MYVIQECLLMEHPVRILVLLRTAATQQILNRRATACLTVRHILDDKPND